MAATEAQQKLQDAMCVRLENGDIAGIKRLVAQGANLDILVYASEYNHELAAIRCAFSVKNSSVMHTLKEWIKLGGDVNFQNGAPMHAAAYAGNIEAMQLFLNAGAKVNASHEIYKINPLHSAAEGGHVSAISFLISLGAKIDHQSPGGTPLHYAAGNARSDAVQALLAAGADMNARIVNEYDGNGQTPLHQGARANYSKRAEGYYEVVRILLQAGADVNAKDAKGRTALDIARAKGNDRLIPLLENPSSAVEVVKIKENINASPSSENSSWALALGYWASRILSVLGAIAVMLFAFGKLKFVRGSK